MAFPFVWAGYKAFEEGRQPHCIFLASLPGFSSLVSHFLERVGILAS